MMTTTLMIYKKVKMRMEERIMILDHKSDDSEGIKEKRIAVMTMMIMMTIRMTIMLDK